MNIHNASQMRLASGRNNDCRSEIPTSTREFSIVPAITSGFVEKIVRKCCKVMEPKNLLKDTFQREILHRYMNKR